MKKAICYLAFLGALSLPCVSSAQYLMVSESTNDRVMLVSAQDGTVLNENFLDISVQVAAAGLTSSIPIEAIEVGNEIWVSDQSADRIWRYSRNQTFLGSIGVGVLDNVRGMEFVGDTVYVAQGSAGTLGEGIVTIDVPSLSITGVFNGRDAADTSYWDVKHYNNELLVTNSDSGNDGIERYALDGTFLGFFAQSDGVTDFDFPQQMNVRGSNGNLLAGGFSTPSGVYEFMSDGTAMGVVAAMDFGPRSGFELGNGDILWTNGTFLRTDTNTIRDDASYRFITSTSIPEPSSLSLLGLLSAGLLIRRRIA